MLLRSFIPFIILCPLLSHGQFQFEKTKVEIHAKPGQDAILVEFPFTIGEAGAQLTGHRGDCRCLSATMQPLQADRSWKKNWKAGEKGTIIGNFDVSGLKRDASHYIDILLPKTKPIRLNVSVKLKKYLVVTPPTHTWDLGGQGGQKVFTIEMSGPKPTKIIAFQAKHENFKHELVTLEEGRKYELRVTPPSTEKPLLEAFSIRTDSEFRQFKKEKFFAIVRPEKKG